MSHRRLMTPAIVAVLMLGLVACGTGTGGGGGAGGDCGRYPSKPIRFIVHTSAGGGSDVFARKLAEIARQHDLSTRPLVVENLEGGSGANAIRAVAEGDDHTIIATPISVIVNTLRGGVGVDFDELTPVARIQLDPNVWMVKADAPWKDARQLLEDAKRNPGDISVGFGTIGSSDHLLFYQVAKATGAEFSYVNHGSGGDAMVSLLGGHIDMASGQPSEVAEQIKAGEVRGLLALSTDERLRLLPDVPTAKELDINVTGESPRLVLGAPGMCPEAVEYLENLFREVSETPEWHQYVEENGVVSAYQDSKELAAYLDKLVAEIDPLIDEMGLRQK